MVITLTSPLVNLFEQDISVTRKNLNSQQVIGRVKTFGPHQVQRKQPVLKGVSLVNEGENNADKKNKRWIQNPERQG